MKKLLFIAMLALGFSTVNAQEGSFNVGANLGFATGDVSDAYSLVLDLEANYLFDLSDEFSVGPSLSYVTFIPKSDYNDFLEAVSFLPIDAAIRYNASEQFTIGADLGYALSLEEDGEGGFNYRPLVGYNVSENIMIQAAYNAITNDGTASFFSVGAVFGL